MCSPECYKFQTCEAPLCPMDAMSLEHGIWYTDEAICASQKLEERPKWIAMQRRIAKIGSPGYFTLEMLTRERYWVVKGLRGLDPDKPEESQLATWMKKHGGKKREPRAALRKRLAHSSECKKNA